MTGRGALLAAALFLAMPALRVVGQDIEAEAALRGVQLPDSYYRIVQEDPDFFTLPNGLFRVDGAGVRRAPATGTASVPVILALFSDSEDPGTLFSREEIQRVLFDGPSDKGTITQAMTEMSLGQFTVTGEVFPWVRTSKTMLEVVGTENGFGEDADLGSYYVEALDLVDQDVDFGAFDNDGPDGVPNSGDDDGIVDALVVEYLEIAGSCGGPSIWPHRSSMRARTGTGEPYQTDDASAHPEKDVIEVDGYITQGVSDCTGEKLQTANVITHEYGHVLGLPDYYHWVDRSAGPRGRRWVLGCWGLMAAGSWGCGDVEEEGEIRDPFGPSHLSAQSKAWLGWVELMDPGEVWNEEIVLEPIQASGVGLRIPLDDVGAEYLVVEYRGQIGFDAGLPAAGVLFYHRDERLPLGAKPNPTTDDPYPLTLLERDDDDGLMRMALEGGDRGVAGDAWGIEGLAGKLNYHSSPSLVLNTGDHPRAMVHEVRVEGDQATIVLSTGATPRLIAPPAPFEVMQIRTFEAPVRIAGGRGPYTGIGELPAGFSLEPAGDELVLLGSLSDVGPFEYSYRVRDGDGNESEPVTVQVSAPLEWVVEPLSLVEFFLDEGSEVLTPGELAHLDGLGNQNGRYDVGDLRKWFRENR
ncbi:MAG: immune inhibitor A [Longimicrobiales bacterium]|nr:immune inhibitor A [Longimicrobiales bacterium]